MRKNEPVLDRLPESMAFRDTGCDVHPSCLTCPLPQCRYDEPGWRQREERTERDVEIVRMRGRLGLSVEELAMRFGVSTRTVHRILGRSQAVAVRSLPMAS